MKTFFVLGALASFSAANATLVGHWTFDETSGSTAFDSSVSGYNGTLMGSAAFVGGGVSGGALSLTTAGNSYVTMGNVLGLTGTDFTISVWINTTSTGGEVVLAKHDAGYFNGYIMQTNAASGYGSPNKAMFYTSNAPGPEAISTTSINNGQWHHLAASYQAGVTSLYVDGNLESVKATGTVGANTRDFIVGGLYAFTNNVGGYNGLIDDVQVYNNALSGGDVSYLFANAGSPVPEPASVACLLAGVGALAARRRRKN